MSMTLPQFLWKTEEKGKFPDSFCEAIIILTTKPDEDSTRKEKHQQVSLVNIVGKTLNKRGNWVQQGT